MFKPGDKVRCISSINGGEDYDPVEGQIYIVTGCDGNHLMYGYMKKVRWGVNCFELVETITIPPIKKLTAAEEWGF